MKRYYIEITNVETQDYLMQSKWFTTAKQCEKWLANNIDYIDFDNYALSLMVADFYDDNYDNIMQLYYITAENFNNLKRLYKGEK